MAITVERYTTNFINNICILISGSVYTTMAITVERYTTITNSCWKVGMINIEM